MASSMATSSNANPSLYYGFSLLLTFTIKLALFARFLARPTFFFSFFDLAMEPNYDTIWVMVKEVYWMLLLHDFGSWLVDEALNVELTSPYTTLGNIFGKALVQGFKSAYMAGTRTYQCCLTSLNIGMKVSIVYFSIPILSKSAQNIANSPSLAGWPLVRGCFYISIAVVAWKFSSYLIAGSFFESTVVTVPASHAKAAMENGMKRVALAAAREMTTATANTGLDEIKGGGGIWEVVPFQIKRRTLLKPIVVKTDISQFKGETLAIDGYVWLHKGSFGCATEIVRGEKTLRYVDYCMHRVRMLVYHHIKPYIVLDGTPLSAKRGTEIDRAQRRAKYKELGDKLWDEGRMKEARDAYTKAVDVTGEMVWQLIKALNAEGIPFVVAPYEADAQLRYLEQEGIVDGIITEDSDLVIYGAKRVIYKFNGKDPECDFIDAARLGEIYGFSKWSEKELRWLAIFSGCDYLSSVNGIGLAKAQALILKYKNPTKAIQHLKMDFDVPDNYLQSFFKAELCFKHQRVFDPRSQTMVSLTALEAGRELTDEEERWIGEMLDATTAQRLACGELDPNTKKEVVDINREYIPKVIGSKSADSKTSIRSYFKPAPAVAIKKSVSAPNMAPMIRSSGLVSRISDQKPPPPKKSRISDPQGQVATVYQTPSSRFFASGSSLMKRQHEVISIDLDDDDEGALPPIPASQPPQKRLKGVTGEEAARSDDVAPPSSEPECLTSPPPAFAGVSSEGVDSDGNVSSPTATPRRSIVEKRKPFDNVTNTPTRTSPSKRLKKIMKTSSCVREPVNNRDQAGCAGQLTSANIESFEVCDTPGSPSHVISLKRGGSSHSSGSCAGAEEKNIEEATPKPALAEFRAKINKFGFQAKPRGKQAARINVGRAITANNLGNSLQAGRISSPLISPPQVSASSSTSNIFIGHLSADDTSKSSTTATRRAAKSPAKSLLSDGIEDVDSDDDEIINVPSSRKPTAAVDGPSSQERPRIPSSQSSGRSIDIQLLRYKHSVALR